MVKEPRKPKNKGEGIAVHGFFRVALDNGNEGELVGDKADEATKTPLDKIQQQIERMNKIITELIELARLESSSAVDQTKEVDIATLLDDVYNDALALDKNEHVIELIIDPKESDKQTSSLFGSYEELRMAFSNLLTNAIRYTPAQGNIKLLCTVSDASISISVQDSGLGISYEHIPRLTERFYRVDEGRSSEKGGTGLGLSIVKHILDRHNASIYIQSKVGEGSTFRCDFPILHPGTQLDD